MIIEEYDESLFIQRFENMKRVTTDENAGNFSYKGLRALFEYLDDCFDEENPLKLDVISLCCDYSEYKDLEAYLNDYNTDIEEEDFVGAEDLKLDEDEYKKAIEEEISDKTTLIKFGEDLNEGFIIGTY